MIYRTRDEKLMAMALRLAVKGLGETSPNPVVGCLLYKNGHIIAKDYHHKAGQPHAEVLVLRKAGVEASGATMYVTLEPCSTYGRTPPCTEEIIKAKVRKVIIGTIDPNPKINGRGVQALKKAGIEVVTGVIKEECKKINVAYNKFITTKLPFVTVKFAQSLDGRIATQNGSSQWISSQQSLKFAHCLRAQNDAILVGANTANRNNPQLTVRLVKGRNPVRIILSESGQVKKNLKLFTDKNAPTILATSRKARIDFDVEKILLPKRSKGLNLETLLRKLSDRDIMSLLVEGGAMVITSFLKQNMVDRIIVIVAPILIGRGVEAVTDLHIKDISQALKLKNVEYKKMGSDFVVFGDLN
ncbi:MAG: riboflavin biosynthesis protein RibD [candidate division Zixibacteria bacterium 4484_95]|nr:MAG: riboflavin biosynthesis protein RibD [candidate division Zixibacteria bacterium 4484_95]